MLNCVYCDEESPSYLITEEPQPQMVYGGTFNYFMAYSIDNMFILPICTTCLIHCVEYHPDVPYREILEI